MDNNIPELMTTLLKILKKNHGELYQQSLGSGLDPFIIGLYVGDEKPKSVDDFVRPLCQEIERVAGIKITINASLVRD